MKRIKKFQRAAAPVLFLLLMMAALTGCSKGEGAKETEGAKKEALLSEINEIPEDGIITKEQFASVAGEKKTVQFQGTTEDGITYVWTYDCAKIQNPEEQNLKIDFSEENLEEIKKQANDANDALKMTMHGKGVICPPTLSVTLPQNWESNAAYLVKEQDGSLAKMSDAEISIQNDATTLEMTVTSLDGECYIIGGIVKVQNQGIGTDKQEKKIENAENEIVEETSSEVYEEIVEEEEEEASNEDSAKNEEAEEEEAALTCTISISCAAILDHMDELKKGKEDFVPSDGWILQPTEVEFEEGESVHDVLQRVCRDAKIHMESSFTPAYNSAYIEGINNLYEFDCGELSGWTYSINGWFPNYGSSKYQVSAGDVICLEYTCNLGKDVGDNSIYE